MDVTSVFEVGNRVLHALSITTASNGTATRCRLIAESGDEKAVFRAMWQLR